ncbi:secretin N-terminal domain-containing protein, partial [Planctomycetota bacterium]
QTLSQKITEIIEKGNPGAIRPRGSSQTVRLPDIAQIQPDERTNSLIVIANRQTMEIIKDLVVQLDVERPAGTENTHFIYLRHAQAKPTADSLSAALVNLRNAQPNDNLAPPVSITPDESTNSLIIQASPQDYQIIAGIIEKLDIEREQVLVELFIVEVGEENLLEIGIDWATMDQAVSDTVRFFGGTNFGIRVDAASDNLEGFSVGAFKEVGGQVQIGAILNALEKESSVNIRSKPNLLTSNHQLAHIFVGETVPFLAQNRILESASTTQPIIQTIDYRNVGVTLDITPHVSQGGQVGLEIDSKFTQLIESVTGLSADTPTTSTREIQTTISMASGQTVVIGGLIRDDKITIEKKIPLLGDIPLLGALFKFQRDRIQKTNLLLFITPYILTSQADLAAASTMKQNEIAPQLDKIKTPKH